MRKLSMGALVGVLLLSLAAIAYAAVENTMTYKSQTSPSTKSPTKAKPANLFYRGTIAINTNPPELQPDAAPTTTVFFSKYIRNNAKYWPSCTQAEIDGKAQIPAKCAKARVSVPGKSTARAYAGVPGDPKSKSAQEDLTVEVYNGPSGRKLFLVVTAKPGAPVPLTNRVVPGTVVRASGPYGFAVRFDIPADLQEQFGLKVSLTDFDVHVARTVRTIKVGTRKVRAAYLQLVQCPRGRKLAVKAETKFRDSKTNELKAVTSVSSSKC